VRPPFCYFYYPVTGNGTRRRSTVALDPETSLGGTLARFALGALSPSAFKQWLPYWIIPYPPRWNCQPRSLNNICFVIVLTVPVQMFVEQIPDQMLCQFSYQTSSNMYSVDFSDWGVVWLWIDLLHGPSRHCVAWQNPIIPHMRIGWMVNAEGRCRYEMVRAIWGVDTLSSLYQALFCKRLIIRRGDTTSNTCHEVTSVRSAINIVMYNHLIHEQLTHTKWRTAGGVSWWRSG
jgi:hypothetical protein